jgi:hypothetical protein
VPPGAALKFSLRDPRIASKVSDGEAFCRVSRPARVAETLRWVRFPIFYAAWEELNAPPFATDDPEAMRGCRPA